MVLLERIRKTINEYDFGLPQTITASFGLSTARNDQNCDMERLLLLADKALYEAKQTGRNKVCTREMEQAEENQEAT